MKRIIILLGLIPLLVSCVGSKEIPSPISKQSYALKLVQIANEEGALNAYEFQFYNPKSARSAEIMITKKFGTSKEANPGKYQENINQFIWKNITLLGDGVKFSILTDGIETRNDYFTTIMVFDQNNVDALSPLYPRQVEIVDSLKSYLKPYCCIR